MKNRGEVNISFADYLYHNRDILNIKKIGMKYIEVDDINHLIIGRWYYGLFLIAKDYLVNVEKYITNCNNTNCPYCNIGNYCNGRCFKHKYNQKVHAHSIWHIIGKLKKFNGKYADIIKGERLAKMREKYEYYNIDNKSNDCICSVSDLNNAKTIFKEIYNALS